MLIKILGTRGSIPVSNKRINKYGGNTTCLYIESSAGDIFIIDAGSGIRELGPYLIENNKLKFNMIFTHYHWDHMQGLPFFAPIFLKNSVINIYGPKKEVTAEKALSYQMHKPYFPTVTWSNIPAKISYKELKKEFRIGSLKINTIPNNHPNYTIGLKFTERKHSVVLITDNELFAKNGPTSYKQFVNFAKDAQLLIHDAQYTDEVYKSRIGWGHSTYNQVINLASDAGIKKVMFTHHDPSSSDEHIDKIVKAVKKQYPNQSVEAAAEGKTIILK